jgi:hypothetical protein
LQIFPKDNADNLAKNTITRNIYRFGWHFPDDVLTKVCSANGLLSPGDVNNIRNPLSAETNPNTVFATENNIVDLVFDLFPDIPEKDLRHVLEHAFKRVRWPFPEITARGLTSDRAQKEWAMQKIYLFHGGFNSQSLRIFGMS